MKTLWEKIKLIWNGRAIAENLLKLKSRWREPAFWVALLGNGISILATYKGSLDPRLAITANAALTSGWNYVRGLEKAQTEGVAPYKSSSEFWMGIATMVTNILIGVQSGGITTPYLAGSSIVLIHAVAVARELANMRPKEVVAATGEPISKPA